MFFKEPGIVPPVIIKDMRIYLGNHGSLGMPGVTLDSFNIAAVQFQFISDTGMAQAVEYDLRKIMFFDQLCKFLLNHRGFPGSPGRSADDQIVIVVFISESIPCVILLFFEIHKHLCNRARQEDLADTALCLRSFQNHDGYGSLIL